jgi:caa(3)-type oxidase subunit IV
MPDRVVPARTYIVVCAGLLLLTALTAGLAHVNLGGLNSPVALAIAAVKAARNPDCWHA